METAFFEVCSEEKTPSLMQLNLHFFPLFTENQRKWKGSAHRKKARVKSKSVAQKQNRCTWLQPTRWRKKAAKLYLSLFERVNTENDHIIHFILNICISMLKVELAISSLFYIVLWHENGLSLSENYLLSVK